MDDKIRVPRTEKVSGTIISDDGRHVAIKLTQPSGLDIVVSVPTGEIQNLILLLSQSVAGAARKHGTDPTAKHVMDVEDWRFGVGPDDRLFLNLVLPGGGDVSFRLPAGARQRMQEKLSAMENEQSAETVSE